MNTHLDLGSLECDPFLCFFFIKFVAEAVSLEKEPFELNQTAQNLWEEIAENVLPWQK